MKKLFALAALTLFTACEQAPPPPVFPPISFSQKTPIRLDVAEIRVVENYRPTLAAPNVEHNFQTPPNVALKTWASQRLQAVGKQGILEFVIEDASVIEKPLPKTDGVRGFFTDDQSERYDAKTRVVMRLYTGARAAADAEGDVNVMRSKSIAEKATINDREQLFYDMTVSMMQQFDTEAETRLRQYFGAFLR